LRLPSEIANPHFCSLEAKVVEFELLLIDTVAVVQAVRCRDFAEARFRCKQVEDRAWAENVSTIGNAALTLEVALRHAETAQTVRWGQSLQDLTTAVEAYLQPERDHIFLAACRRAAGK
jgi:hypothetical protein